MFLNFYAQITKCGELICEFDLPLKKQPFERIFIACHEDSSHDFNIPNEKMIFSIPSAIHSNKPPLQGNCQNTMSYFVLCLYFINQNVYVYNL